MEERIRIGVFLFLLAASGCFSYSGHVKFTQATGSRPTFNKTDLTRVTSIVAEIAREHRMVPDPRFPEIERNSRNDSEWKERVLSLHMLEGDKTDQRVGLWMLKDKESGEVSVLVRDLDSLRGTDFTTSLERSLQQELAAAFPSWEIRVDRETIGPSLGP